VNLALSVVTLVVLVAALEGGARLLEPVGFMLVPTGGNCIKRDPLLGYRLQPGCSGVLHGTPVRTNALGLRGPEVSSDGRPRILALGDSCTFGWLVREAQAYPALLEARLADAGGRPFRVLNAGVPGYTTHQGLIELRERGPALRPEIVVIAFGFNDAARDGDLETQLAGLRASARWVRLDDWLMTHSLFWQRLRHTLERPADKGSGVPPRIPLERYEANLRSLVGLAREQGAKPVLVSFWSEPLFGMEESPHTRPYREAVDRVGRELDVPVVPYKGPKMDMVHPTAEGYYWLVTDLVDALDGAGYTR
jgi:lysophospholipase L1-like esterase